MKIISENIYMTKKEKPIDKLKRENALLMSLNNEMQRKNIELRGEKIITQKYCDKLKEENNQIKEKWTQKYNLIREQLDFMLIESKKEPHYFYDKQLYCRDLSKLLKLWEEEIEKNI